MGRVDPSSVSAYDVKGGGTSQVTVVFTGEMGAGDQDPVVYSGDVDALAPNDPNACPNPPSSFGVTQCTFNVATVPVTSIKTVTITVQGPTCNRSTVIKIKP
jgi:hypothetical protein